MAEPDPDIRLFCILDPGGKYLEQADRRFEDEERWADIESQANTYPIHPEESHLKFDQKSFEVSPLS